MQKTRHNKTKKGCPPPKKTKPKRCPRDLCSFRSVRMVLGIVIHPRKHQHRHPRQEQQQVYSSTPPDFPVRRRRHACPSGAPRPIRQPAHRPLPHTEQLFGVEEATEQGHHLVHRVLGGLVGDVRAALPQDVHDLPPHVPGDKRVTQNTKEARGRPGWTPAGDPADGRQPCVPQTLCNCSEFAPRAPSPSSKPLSFGGYQTTHLRQLKSLMYHKGPLPPFTPRTSRPVDCWAPLQGGRQTDGQRGRRVEPRGRRRAGGETARQRWADGL